MRSPARGRITLLCLILLLVGSPWGQDRVEEFYVDHLDSEMTRWLVEGAFVPRWDFSSDAYLDYAGSNMLVVQNISVVLLLVALARVMSWSRTRGASGWGRLLVAGVLVSEIVALLRWWMLDTFVEGLGLSTAGLRQELLHAALSFGLMAGVLLALLTVGLPRVHVNGAAGATKALFRPRKGVAAMTTPQAHMPVGSMPGDVTRYLCAAAYVDEGFADRVVDGVLADEAGAVAPSPDVDLVAVSRHCLAAQDLRRDRDLRLTGAFAVVALFAPLWLLFPAVLLSAVTAASRPRPSLATRGRRQPGSRVVLGAGITAVVVVLCVLPFAVALASLPVSGFASWLFGAYLAGVPAVLASVGATVFAYATVVRHALAVDRLLRTTMTRETFTRQPPPSVPRRVWIARRLAVVKEARDGNVTVYSGFSPFVGYAQAASNWSLAVPLLPADETPGKRSRPAEPEAFTVVELVDHVREQLRSVAARGGVGGTADAAAKELRSLTVEDRVFVDGRTIGDDPRFMSTNGLTPAARLSAGAVQEIMLHPTGTVRHHLAVHVPLWGGDVVPSVFLHFSTEGRTLHLHCGNHVLGPVDAAYHVVDRLRDPLTPERRRGLLTEALPRTGPAFLGAPSRALRQARFEARRTRRMVDELTAMEHDPVFDYGARLSVREMALSPSYHNYFQVVDAGRITAAVERHTLAAIREFLDARGYDITDFRSQQQTILNQGLIQQGGTSIIGNQAIGPGSSATQNVTRKAGPAATAGAEK
ncbi:hypothetical protein GCM10023084_69960 [Streptomyces lacrimifluminis]|uniref:Uncharacterized protein n=1 Tax=Streptomyces lacrimifluminis TaxID=1500077 RepID=A0A917UJ36_9ACTN|nr:hypothetical protein [Streptomyces lacrimifluminis]GGJ61706.1 hypothetical protein GCM10012282_68720 [Streptomyces lacrimifluminis]